MFLMGNWMLSIQYVRILFSWPILTGNALKFSKTEPCRNLSDIIILCSVKCLKFFYTCLYGLLLIVSQWGDRCLHLTKKPKKKSVQICLDCILSGIFGKHWQSRWGLLSEHTRSPCWPTCPYFLPRNRVYVHVHVWMENCTDSFCPTGSQRAQGKCPGLETGKFSQIPKYRQSHREPGSGSPVLWFSCSNCPKGSENGSESLYRCLLFHKSYFQGRRRNVNTDMKSLRFQLSDPRGSVWSEIKSKDPNKVVNWGKRGNLQQ